MNNPLKKKAPPGQGLHLLLHPPLPFHPSLCRFSPLFFLTPRALIFYFCFMRVPSLWNHTRPTTRFGEGRCSDCIFEAAAPNLGSVSEERSLLLHRRVFIYYLAAVVNSTSSSSPRFYSHFFPLISPFPSPSSTSLFAFFF